MKTQLHCFPTELAVLIQLQTSIWCCRKHALCIKASWGQCNLKLKWHVEFESVHCRHQLNMHSRSAPLRNWGHDTTVCAKVRTNESVNISNWHDIKFHAWHLNVSSSAEAQAEATDSWFKLHIHQCLSLNAQHQPVYRFRKWKQTTQRPEFLRLTTCTNCQKKSLSEATFALCRQERFTTVSLNEVVTNQLPTLGAGHLSVLVRHLIVSRHEVVNAADFVSENSHVQTSSFGH